MWAHFISPSKLNIKELFELVTRAFFCATHILDLLVELDSYLDNFFRWAMNKALLPRCHQSLQLFTLLKERNKTALPCFWLLTDLKWRALKNHFQTVWAVNIFFWWYFLLLLSAGLSQSEAVGNIFCWNSQFLCKLNSNGYYGRIASLSLSLSSRAVC